MQYNQVPSPSYIPQQNRPSSAVPFSVKRKNNFRILNAIGSMAFIGVLLSAVGVFLYENYLNKQLSDAKTHFASLNTADVQSKMDTVRTYDRQLHEADMLLKNHISGSRIFDALETSTKETVKLGGIKFTYDPGHEAKITFDGGTKEFASVALQRMEYLKGTLFKDFTIADITTGIENSSDKSQQTDTNSGALEKVTFSIEGTFKKDILLYSNATTTDTQTTSYQNTVPTNTVSTTSTSSQSNIVTP